MSCRQSYTGGVKAVLLPTESLYTAPVTMLAEYYARKLSAAFVIWDEMSRRIFSAAELFCNLWLAM